MEGSTAAHWQLVGPVHTLIEDYAEWNAALEAWGPLSRRQEVVFRIDGWCVSARYLYSNGSFTDTVFTYDAAGRLTERHISGSDGWMSRTRSELDELGRPRRTVEIAANGTERLVETFDDVPGAGRTRTQYLPEAPDGVTATYSTQEAGDLEPVAVAVPGATTAVTRYDNQSRQVDVRFYDAAHRLVNVISVARDAQGRVTSVEVTFTDDSPFAMPAAVLEGKSAEDVARIRTLMRAARNGRLLTERFQYDESSRLRARTWSFGSLGEQRTTFGRDDHGNVVEQIEESDHHELHMDDDGTLHEVERPGTSSRHRREYQYDDRGNWTERILLIADGSKFRRHSVERRTISYWAD